LRWRRENGERDPFYRSPVRLLVLLAVSIFLGETCVMLLLHLLPTPHPVVEAFLDACMLLIIVSPTLYFFLFQPFMQQLRRQQQSEDEIRALSRLLMAATEEERRRIAMDLHDHFGQVLTSLHLGLQRMGGGLTPLDPQATRQCLEMADAVSGLHDEIRRYAAGLRPSMIDDLGLLPALQWLFAEQRLHYPEMQLEFSALGVKRHISGQVAEAVYRISEEALNNVVKHAAARRVDVALICSHPHLILTIRDDGAGFEVPVAGQGGIGLWSMRERAVMAGGRLTVSSRPGAGTTVRAELPMPPEL
jgi:signal transduction histidine kinase